MSEKIDFELVEEFRTDCNFYRVFWPIYYLNRMYRLVCELIMDGISTDDCDRPGIKYSDVMAEKPLYKVILAIMQSNEEQAEMLFDAKGIDVNYPISSTALAMHLTSGWQSMGRMNFLSIAALLGRLRIFRYLIDHGADAAKMIIPSGINPAPYPLSVIECLLMNFIYRWYQQGKRSKMKDNETRGLIDAIVLAGTKCPSIVSDARVLEAPVRISYYWEMLKEIVEDTALLQPLIQLNPEGMREILHVRSV